MENWQFVLYDAMQTDVNKALSGIYFVSWIFIGNFMLLNLFLAILLDSFVEEDEEANLEFLPESEKQEIAKKKVDVIMKKEGEDLIVCISKAGGPNSGKKQGSCKCFD
jgi:hypothetical protein